MKNLQITMKSRVKQLIQEHLHYTKQRKSFGSFRKLGARKGSIH
ncbi:hypothetical protein ACEQPO_15895 [Bacillus sp. SL00103]